MDDQTALYKMATHTHTHTRSRRKCYIFLCQLQIAFHCTSLTRPVSVDTDTVFDWPLQPVFHSKRLYFNLYVFQMHQSLLQLLNSDLLLFYRNDKGPPLTADFTRLLGSVQVCTAKKWQEAVTRQFDCQPVEKAGPSLSIYQLSFRVCSAPSALVGPCWQRFANCACWTGVRQSVRRITLIGYSA